MSSALVMFFVVASGCELLGTNSNHSSDLAVNKRIWTSQNDGNYTFSLTRSCFCIYGGRFTVQVAGNEIVRVDPSDGVDPGDIPEEDYQYFQTVDDIFEILEQAYENNADDVDVDYSDRGYPKRVMIDYYKNGVDDELSFTVSDLVMTSSG